MNPYSERVRHLQALMEEKDVDALIIIDLPNYYYFTGDWRKQPRVFIPREGEPTLIVFAGEEEQVREGCWIKDVRGYRAVHEMMMAIIGLLKDHGYDEGTVGLVMDFSLPAFLYERFKLANPGVKVVDATDLVMELRMIKAPEEIEAIRRAEEIAVEAFERAKEVIKPRVTELDVAMEIEYTMRKAGAMGFSFPTFVNAGEKSKCLHGMATENVIREGDPILIDVGPLYKGYSGDMTRMFSVGEPKGNLRRLMEIYLEARGAAIEAARPGVRVMELDNAFYQILKDYDLGEYQIRGIAHGVGLNFEEKPFSTIFPEDSLVELREDMVLSFGHPLLWVPGRGAVRVEEIYQLTSEGALPLVEYPTEIIVVG